MELLLYSLIQVNGSIRCLLSGFSLPHNESAPKFIRKQDFKWKESVIRHEDCEIRSDLLAAYNFMLGSALWHHS